ncbi:conserved exported hypothetical protein [Bradyrhizobium sp. STM 3843]|uniref:hypothetical protein n=1 Tax=Bradyrhizobium sp. STM 3843 TaxID=551947 RepID=UPI000240ADD7|nr:hypothetical protein [Bradyrhizobium sp. STM 3843]CCE05112.1 conserved exported hypothetical protein [Bradyrhizobium sp. STM 3843]
MRPQPLLVIALLALSVAWAVLVFEMVQSRAARQQEMGTGRLGWREIAWPFPRDGWPAGRAFRCQSATCVQDSEIYLRAKLGFCNCDTGVADDDEVDRVADIDLINPRFAAPAPGRVVRVADLSGRARNYDLESGEGAPHSAIGYALSHRCDLMVAVIKGSAAQPLLEQAAQQFLASHEVQRWMLAALESGK